LTCFKYEPLPDVIFRHRTAPYSRRERIQQRDKTGKKMRATASREQT
jgi:hypothetical protein